MKLIQTKASVLVGQADGTQKKVNATFLVEAATFSEAEAMVAEQIGTTECKSMGIANYDEVVDMNGENYFKVISYIYTIDEVSGKESKSRFVSLVRGCNVFEVSKALEMHKEKGDEIKSVQEIKIQGIINK